MPLPVEEPLDSAIGWVAKHTARYVESGGAEGHEWQGATTLVLTTLGRSSGRLRRNALIYVERDGRYFVVASFGGKPDHPAWYLNLEAEPEVRVQVRDRVMDATTRTLEGAERDAIMPALLEMWPDYATYQEKTDRLFPVVEITPA